MITKKALIDLLNEEHDVEVGIEIETLSDAGIDFKEIASEAKRSYRKVNSTRRTNDSTLELIENWVVFEPTGE